MAEKDKLDLGEEKKTSSKKIVFIVLGAVLATLIAVFATLYFLGIFPPKATTPAAEGKDAHATEQSHGEEGEGEAGEEHEEASHEEKEGHEVPMIYESLEPAFVINFKSNPEARLLQIGLSVASKDQSAIDAVKKHTPMIRNNLLVLIGAEEPASLKTSEGKEVLRAQILEEINAILKKYAKKKKGIEDVFFTSFIMQ